MESLLKLQSITLWRVPILMIRIKPHKKTNYLRNTPMAMQNVWLLSPTKIKDRPRPRYRKRGRGLAECCVVSFWVGDKTRQRPVPAGVLASSHMICEATSTKKSPRPTRVKYFTTYHCGKMMTVMLANVSISSISKCVRFKLDFFKECGSS